MGPFIWTNLNPLHPRMLCAKFGWNWPSGSEKKIFKFRQCIFAIVIISHWKSLWSFIWWNLNPLHPRMLCAKFGWNWPSGSWEEDENVKSLQMDRQTDNVSSSGKLKKLYNLTLRSKIKVKLESWMYTTHRVMVIHPCAKYGKTNVKAKRSNVPDTNLHRQNDRVIPTYLP